MDLSGCQCVSKYFFISSCGSCQGRLLRVRIAERKVLAVMKSEVPLLGRPSRSLIMYVFGLLSEFMDKSNI